MGYILGQVLDMIAMLAMEILLRVQHSNVSAIQSNLPLKHDQLLPMPAKRLIRELNANNNDIKMSL